MLGFDKRFGERSSVPQPRSRPRRGTQQQVEIVGGVSSDDCMIHPQFESNLMWPREVRFCAVEVDSLATVRRGGRRLPIECSRRSLRARPPLSRTACPCSVSPTLRRTSVSLAVLHLASRSSPLRSPAPPLHGFRRLGSRQSGKRLSRPRHWLQPTAAPARYLPRLRAPFGAKEPR